MMIPVIIMGGILSGWFTPTEAGIAAVSYIVLILIPLLRPAHIKVLPQDFMHAGLLYAIPMAAVAGASAFGWMLAYLRGPDMVSDLIERTAGTDPRMILFLLVVLFVIVGDFIDAVPAIIIFMPIINKLTELGGIKPMHMGVTIITTLVFGLITPPYGLSLLMASKFCDVRLQHRDVRLAAALPRLLRHDRVLHLLPGRHPLAAEARAARIGRLLQEPERRGIHLSSLNRPERGSPCMPSPLPGRPSPSAR